MAAHEHPLDRLDGAFVEFSESLDRLGLVPRTLKSITLVLTTGCNLRCSYCYADRKAGRDMAWPVARAALDLIYRRGVAQPRIYLYGGEPMLRPAMVRRVVDHVRRRWPTETRPEIVVCSNGTLLERKTIGWLADNGILLQLSSDGVEAAQQMRGEKVFGTLDDIFRMMIRDFPEYFHRQLTIKLTLSAANLPFLAASIGYLIDLGIVNIDVVPLNTHDSEWVERTSMLLEEQMAAVRKICSNHFLRTGTLPCSIFRSGDTKQRRRGNDRMCGFGQGTQLVVDVDGSLVECAALVPSFQSVRGDLHGQLLAHARIGEVWDFDESTRGALHRYGQGDGPVFRQKDGKWSNAGSCRDCRYVSQCFVCPVSIAHLPGNTDPHRIPANQCDFNMTVGRQRELFRRDVKLPP